MRQRQRQRDSETQAERGKETERQTVSRDQGLKEEREEREGRAAGRDNVPWRQAFSCDSSILWGPNGVQTPPSFLTLRGEHSRSTRKTDVQRLRPRCRSSLKSPPAMTELRSKGTASGHSRGEKRTGRPAARPAAWRPWASQSVPAIAGPLRPWGVTAASGRSPKTGA